MDSAIDSTSSPADSPCRRPLTRPTNESIVAATPRTPVHLSYQHQPRIRRPRRVNDTNHDRVRFSRVVFTRQAPFVEGASDVPQRRLSFHERLSSRTDPEPTEPTHGSRSESSRTHRAQHDHAQGVATAALVSLMDHAHVIDTEGCPPPRRRSDVR